MFDIGFFELLLIGTVALLVLGPERLPKAARTVGLWMRKARASWYSMRAELEREFADEELKRSLAATRAELADARKALSDGGRELAAAGAAASEELRQSGEALRRLDAPAEESVQASAEPAGTEAVAADSISNKPGSPAA
ncbi:Sec-independent protein translocase protein TatB [Pseudomarimonas salicorniae]|uniref:Sec-independent protein translocase protein TatB n=1 Tax=Pseudomarimonas salicorniae TaxID=2933270 RepID=A0ABT0GIP6_9GAMM|nr:Sec-independent protein translocase protein TatB [Lysobacter sp. CAU 1642]